MIARRRLLVRSKALRKKDGSGMVVRIQVEIATQPGVVIQEDWVDPRDTPGVVIEGENVIQFPSPAPFSEVLIKAGRFRVFNGQLVVSNTELVASAARMALRGPRSAFPCLNGQ